MTIGANYNHKNAGLAEEQDATRQESLSCMCRRIQEIGVAEKGINSDITAGPSRTKLQTARMFILQVQDIVRDGGEGWKKGEEASEAF